MAKRKIVWSDTARNSYKEILNFYTQRNGNSKYSKSLSANIKKNLSYLRTNNYLGKISSFEETRVLIFDSYEIFYFLTEQEIVVELIWDSRRKSRRFKIIS